MFTDKRVIAAGILRILTDALEAKFFDYVVYDGTQPKPTVTNVEEDLEVFRRENCDCLVSLGGGSPHDCAKAIGVMVNNPGSIVDYMGLTIRGMAADKSVAAPILFIILWMILRKSSKKTGNRIVFYPVCNSSQFKGVLK